MTVSTPRSTSAAAKLPASSRGLVTNARRALPGSSPRSTSAAAPLLPTPERRSAVQSAQPFTKFPLAPRQPLFMPLKHVSPGAAHSTPGCSLHRQIAQKIMRDVHVVGGPKVVLQTLQVFHERLQLRLIKQAPQKLDRVAELLGGDAQLVPLARRQPAEAFAALAQLGPPPIEQERGRPGNRRTHQRQWLGPSHAPTAGFEPVREVEHFGGVPLGTN